MPSRSDSVREPRPTSAPVGCSCRPSRSDLESSDLGDHHGGPIVSPRSFDCMRTCHRHLATIVTLSVVSLGSKAVFAQADGIEFFESNVRPALATHCISCHGPKAQKGGLRLDSREALLRGGESGPVIVEGDPESSLLIDAVAYESDPKMPPKAKLPADVLDDLKEWVKQGAALARGLADHPGAGEGSVGPVVGVPADHQPLVSARLRPEVAADVGRLVRPEEARRGRAQAVEGRRPPDIDPTLVVHPSRLAADPRRGAGI